MKLIRTRVGNRYVVDANADGTPELVVNEDGVQVSDTDAMTIAAQAASAGVLIIVSDVPFSPPGTPDLSLQYATKADVAAAVDAYASSNPGASNATVAGYVAAPGPTQTAADARYAPVTSVAAVATASATLAANRHTPVDANAAARTMTLPTSPAGALLSVEKIDASANAVNVTGTLRGVAAQSIPLTSQYEARTFLSEGGGSWRPVSDHRTAASLNATYAPYNQGRRVAIEYSTSVSGVAVPAGVTGCFVTIVGAGGGGGSGRRGAAGSVRCGGGGGAAGAGVADLWVPVTQLGTTYTVTPGAAGVGGGARTSDNTDGATGGAGGTSVFVSGNANIQAQGGAGGAGGTAITGTGGVGGGGPLVGASGASASTTGAVPTTNPVTYNGLSNGGGAGGGITAADLPSNGGSSAGSFLYAGATSTGGVVGGAAPVSGAIATGSEWRGSGGGGGAASITAAAQAGAAAFSAVRGSGGGGGGASLNGNNSGAGGNGAPGLVRISWIYG